MADWYHVGDTVNVYFFNYPFGSRSMEDCDSGHPKVYIWLPTEDPSSDTPTVNGTAMTKITTGTYEYEHTATAKGTHNVKKVGVTSSDTTIIWEIFRVI